MKPPAPPPRSELAAGAGFALLAYGAWGFLPAYWKLLLGIPALEILAHRIVWAALFFAGLLAIQSGRGLRELADARAHWKALLASAALISCNWFVYIYAVNSGHILEGSLGYFMNPLLSVLLGRIFLGERLTRLQLVSVALAAAGVLQLALQGDRVPYISLFLAVSFGLYGLVRKRVPIRPLTSSTFEALLLAPPALVYLLVGTAPSATGAAQWGFLVLGGAVTALPLLWFAEAAKRLPLSTLGFFQYIAPTLQLCLAVFFYGESFSAVHARAFACIWAALALYTITLVRRPRPA